MLLNTHFLNSNPVELCKLSEKSKIMANSAGQFSTSSSSIEGDISKPDWKIPLAKLNSAVIQEKEEAKEAIHQLLLSGSKQCHAIMGDLFNLYVKTSCRAAGEILLDQSQQNHVNFLFEKMNEGLKNPEKRYATLMLLWNIIQRQPSWRHTIISTSFFNTFIKCLKVDNDVVILVTGILIITALLPSVPSLVGSILEDFFDIFERLFLYTARQRGITPDTHILHLKVAVYVFFHRFYAMYPNNTVTFMKSFFESNHGKDVQRSIELLLRWVKFHPWLITETDQSETGKDRWRSKEPHDVIVDCEKVSLEPTSCHLQESETLSSVCTSRQSSSEVTMSESSGILTNSDNSMQPAMNSEDERLDMATQTGTSLQNATYQQDESSVDSGTDISSITPLVASSAMINSPTTLCSLTTPPSSKNTSPSGSVHDVSIGHTTPGQLNHSSHEASDARLSMQTPTPLGSRRSSFNHHTANSFAVIDDSSTCGRNTPPILLNPRATPVKEKGHATSESSKYDKKDREKSSFDLIVDDTLRDPSEQKPETPIRPSAEKLSLSKFPWDILDALQPFTTNICNHCLENCSGGSSKKNADWESQLSPAQLLDHYLLFGQNLQQGKLNSIPLTSQEGLDWTHFGGSPPKDEIKILRKELLLLQSELLFERHKCDLHATRNRRLVGKVFQVNAVREELFAVKDQLSVLQKEVANLEQSCREKVKENRQLKEKTESWNQQQAEIMSNLSKANETLTSEKLELEAEVEDFRLENEKLREEVKASKAQIFQLENDLSFLRRLEKENEVLKEKADTQAGNLLVMGEREEQLRDLIHILRTTVEKSPQAEAKLHVYEKELEDARLLINEQNAELLCLKSNFSELENISAQKEHQIKDLKNLIESIKKIWKDKLDAVESKYQTIKRTNQRLESEIMSLHSKLDARKKKDR
ncbi:hamartin-like [Dendronephthya gigantea]|uniref:hamartin-like n=1 Tax=Dendronephthya gigantea TaxID=151771 RepID=UPI00106CFCE7|nr:hamartin-like [Dendronephthya gigantea]